MAETSTIFGFMKYVSATDILSDFKKTVDSHFVNSLKRKIESSFFFDLNVKQSQLCYSDIYTICTQHIKTLSYKTDNVYIDKKT